MLSYLVMRVRLFIALAVSSFLAVSTATNSASAVVLQAKVEHSERLQPVSASLMPGQEFDRSALPDLSSNLVTNHWFPVPAWLAGKWHKDQQTDYFRFDYATKETDTKTRVTDAISDGIWGTQVDPNGQVWQFDATPFITQVDAGDQTVIQIVRSSSPIEVSETRFVRLSVDTQIRVDKATNVIKAVESGEQITSYVPETENLIKRESSAKVFDRFGQPVVLGKSFSYEKRIADFAPQDIYQGKDLRPLFMQFLGTQQQRTSQSFGENTWTVSMPAVRPSGY